jgi:glycosyltransferase involved in cell wall biosynthesis
VLLDNEELRQAFGRAAREAVERYRWGNVAEAVLGVYRDVIQEVGTGARKGVVAFRN